jgi:hypothetical protein
MVVKDKVPLPDYSTAGAVLDGVKQGGVAKMARMDRKAVMEAPGGSSFLPGRALKNWLVQSLMSSLEERVVQEVQAAAEGREAMVEREDHPLVFVKVKGRMVPMVLMARRGDRDFGAPMVPMDRSR